MELTKALNSMNLLNTLELKALGYYIAQKLIISEMQNGRINSIEEQATRVCFDNMIESFDNISVKSKNYGDFKMRLESYILENSLPNGFLSFEFVSDDIIDDYSFHGYKKIYIELKDIENIKIYDIGLVHIETNNDLIEMMSL